MIKIFSLSFVFIISIPIFFIMNIIFIIKSKKKYKTICVKKYILLNLFLLYLICVIAITMFPLMINLNKDIKTKPNINIIPIIDIIKSIKSLTNSTDRTFMIKFILKNIIGNFLLLFPLGFLLPIIKGTFRNSKKTIFFCFLASLSIETLQYFSFYLGNIRSVDIDDLILNTLGGAFGYFIFHVIYINDIFKKIPYTITKNIYS